MSPKPGALRWATRQSVNAWNWPRRRAHLVSSILTCAARAPWTQKLADKDGISERVFDDWRATWLRRLHPEDSVGALARMDAALAGQQTDFRDTWRMERTQGGLRWFLCAARIFRNADGVAERMVGVNVDIQEQKELQERVAAQVLFQQVLIDTIPMSGSEAKMRRSLPGLQPGLCPGVRIAACGLCWPDRAGAPQLPEVERAVPGRRGGRPAQWGRAHTP